MKCQLIKLLKKLSIPWSDSSRFFNPVIFPSQFSGRLVEPGPDILLPRFMEVPIGHHIVAFTHFESAK